MTAARDTRLATYGTLAPGRANHGQLADLDGAWSVGWVFGNLREAGWGAGLGFPGMTPDAQGARIEVFLFTSADLPDHWHRLDTFEGAGYRRTKIEVHTEAGHVSAWIYALAD